MWYLLYFNTKQQCKHILIYILFVNINKETQYLHLTIFNAKLRGPYFSKTALVKPKYIKKTHNTGNFILICIFGDITLHSERYHMIQLFYCQWCRTLYTVWPHKFKWGYYWSQKNFTLIFFVDVVSLEDRTLLEFKS